MVNLRLRMFVTAALSAWGLQMPVNAEDCTKQLLAPFVAPLYAPLSKCANETNFDVVTPDQAPTPELLKTLHENTNCVVTLEQLAKTAPSCQLLVHGDDDQVYHVNYQDVLKYLIGKNTPQ